MGLVLWLVEKLWYTRVSIGAFRIFDFAHLCFDCILIASTVGLTLGSRLGYGIESMWVIF